MTFLYKADNELAQLAQRALILPQWIVKSYAGSSQVDNFVHVLSIPTTSFV